MGNDPSSERATHVEFEANAGVTSPLPVVLFLPVAPDRPYLMMTTWFVCTATPRIAPGLSIKTLATAARTKGQLSVQLSVW